MTTLYEEAIEPDERSPCGHRLVHQPALDGVRAVAVIAVIVFHLDTSFLPGGYVGVSLFFTLSGFLITSLLLDEWHDTQAISLKRFYTRRIRRLVPASLVTLGLVVLLAAVGVFASTASLRGDIIAASLNVFNWREVTGGGSYGDLFAEQSPVAHFWSLAIEEQFYLVWPIVMLVLLRTFSGGRRLLFGVIGVAYLASLAASFAAGPTITYFATWTRVAEILGGALLAVWTATTTRPSFPHWWRFLALPAIVAFVLAAGFSARATGWAYEGGLGIFALVGVALIAGLQVDGPVRRALSNRVLAGIGAISYGLYLVHWPIFVLLDERRLGTDGAMLVGTRLSATVVAALVLFVVVERPIRLSANSVSLKRIALVAGAGSIAVAGAATLLVEVPPTLAPAPAVLGAAAPTEVESTPRTAPEAPVDARESDATSATPGSDVEPLSEPVPATPAFVDEGPLRLAVFGDSVPAWLLRDSVADFARDDIVLFNGTAEACDGMVGLPVGRDRHEIELTPPDSCSAWSRTYASVIDAGPERAEVGLLVLGQAPIVDRLIDDTWVHPCDGIRWYLDDLAARVSYLQFSGVRPVVALPARYGNGVTFVVPDDAGERMACIRDEMTSRMAELGVATVDLDTLLCPDDDCNRYRTKDGIHVDPEFAPEILDSLLDAVVEPLIGKS